MPIEVTLESALSVDELAPMWQALAERARTSVFLSWPWVGCWLRETGLKANLLVACRHGTVVGLALLHRPASRHPWDLPSLHLTSAGGDAFDSIFIEYNGFLAAEGEAAAVAVAFVDFLARQPIFGKAGWSKLALPGVGVSLQTILADKGLSLRSEGCRASPLIDLSAIREQGGNYLETRSRNCRHQIRRSIRLLEANEPLRLVPAESVEDALATLDELKKLHQSTWLKKGQPGAFSMPFFERFHRSLIRESWASGHIDLLRLRRGSETVGCLYNFIHDGCAYAYQSGFDFSRDSRYKPGMVSHALAAQKYLEAGLDRYLLLAGDNRCKKSLATDNDTLHWLVVHRPGMLAAARDLARIVRRLARRLPLRKALPVQ